MATQVLGFNGKFTAKITVVGLTSASAQIPESYKYENNSVLVSNFTNQYISVRFSEDSVKVATEIGEGITLVGAGLQAILEKGHNDFVSVIAPAAATGSVFITVGN